MFNTFQRVGMLTAALCMAAGATAFASITVEPSNSITLQTKVRGMGGDPDRESAMFTVTTRNGLMTGTSNTCTGLLDVRVTKNKSHDTSGSDQPSELGSLMEVHVTSRKEPGSCSFTFTGGGGHAATVHVRVVKP